MENMDHNVRKIRHHPLAGGEPVNRIGTHPVLFKQPVLDLRENGFEVRLRVARADQEEIRETRDPPQVDGYDILGFLVGCDSGDVLD